MSLSHENEMMTHTFSPLFADELVICLTEGRDPSVQELLSVAERIWSDGAAGRSAMAWHGLPERSADRANALQVAQLALYGTSD